jgi:tRNA threonylcarbamoyladenosine biosynthesis protein TsaE
MKIKKILSAPTENDILAFGAQLAKTTLNGTVLFLYGVLGAGKTTFARGFLQGMGYQGKVKSPTYTLVEPYEIAKRHIFHFDLYRLTTAKELEYIGIHDYFAPSTICLIEWPEKGGSVLPLPDLAGYITFAQIGRHIELRAYSPRGEKALRHGFTE